MKARIWVFLICAVVAPAQDKPNFSGVWKANAEKSKSPSPPPLGTLLMVIEQQGPKLTQTSSQSIGHGPGYRWSYTYDTSGAETMNALRGIPMKNKTAWEGGSLVADGQVAGPTAGALHEKYTLSSDGQTLTVERVTARGSRKITQLLVFEKQPEEAAAPLRQPEMTAGDMHKNVKIMKDVPGSQFADAMSSFSASLGVQCGFCHVQNAFDKDDKKEKETARKMIQMTQALNRDNFDGKRKVRCFTCHQGKKEPVSTVPFAD